MKEYAFVTWLEANGLAAVYSEFGSNVMGCTARSKRVRKRDYLDLKKAFQ